MITPRRRFTLLDAVALIAATGLGLAWGRTEWMEALGEGLANELPSPKATLELLLVALLLLVPCAATWSATLVGLRLRSPRPPRRHLTRQPGLIACLMATITFLMVILMAIIGLTILFAPNYGPRPIEFFKEFVLELFQVLGSLEFFLMSIPLVGMGVLTSWLTLVVGRRCRPEPSWIDRLGRVLGVYWITAGIFSGVGIIVYWPGNW